MNTSKLLLLPFRFDFHRCAVVYLVIFDQFTVA